MTIVILLVLLCTLVCLSIMYRRDRKYLNESTREHMRQSLLDEANSEIEQDKRRKELFREAIKRAKGE